MSKQYTLTLQQLIEHKAAYAQGLSQRADDMVFDIKHATPEEIQRMRWSVEMINEEIEQLQDFQNTTGTEQTRFSGKFLYDQALKRLDNVLERPADTWGKKGEDMELAYVFGENPFHLDQEKEDAHQKNEDKLAETYQNDIQKALQQGAPGLDCLRTALLVEARTHQSRGDPHTAERLEQKADILNDPLETLPLSKVESVWRYYADWLSQHNNPNAIMTPALKQAIRIHEARNVTPEAGGSSQGGPLLHLKTGQVEPGR